ncbi:MAG: PAS domain S-box protein [Oxalobacteraceae bacterium]|nr:MAG: PAS domain S-box protein [Oxalobacteraceae bacterium]
MVGFTVSDRQKADWGLRESEERLRQFGEASQNVLWLRDAGTLQWSYLTPAFETIYGLSREEVLAGDNYRSWLELIVPEDRPIAEDAVQRVRRGERVTFDYRIRRPVDGAIRWLRDTDFPLADRSSEITMFGGVGHDLTELRETELRLQALVDGIPQLVWRAVGGGEWTWASPQWTEYTGQAEADSHGRGWLEPLHPDDHEIARQAWSTALERGGFEVEYRIRHAENQIYRWFQTRATAVRDNSGAIVEWLGTSTDIDELRKLQARQQILVTELQHRTFNLMGVVRSMADATVRSSSNLEEFTSKFADRVDALARVQRLLSRLEEGDSVFFDELICSELSAVGAFSDGDERVSLQGPSRVALHLSTVQTLAMVIHELTTNAVKYGALKQPEGRLHVGWRLDRPDSDGKPWLHVDWYETGVAMPPADAVPRGTGQGRALIEQALPYQLQARTTYTMSPDGVKCSISLPIPEQG